MPKTAADLFRDDVARLNAERLERDKQLAAAAAHTPPTPSPADLARAEARDSLMKFIPWATPAYGEPLHLKPIVDVFERAIAGESVRVCFCAPPQHGKSDTLSHAVAWGLWKRPDWRFGYATYGDALVKDKSRLAQRVVRERLGMALDTTAVAQWDTPEGGGFVGTSIRGAFTGKRVNLTVIDDPYKNRAEAESPTTRRTVVDFLNDVVETRLTPDGSCIAFLARWNPEDLIAHCIKEGWTFVRLQALNDVTGEPLWPQRWSKEALEKKRERVGDFTWESLYQGRPRPRGSVVFGPPTTYTELPKVFRTAGGLDLSYAAKKSSHWSVAVLTRKAGGKLYVVDVLRRKVDVTVFRRELHALHSKAPSTRWRWYTSTTETGLGQMFREAPFAVPVVPVLAKADKLTRALPCAAAWNRGDVLVPENAPWLDEFLAVITNFTGTGGQDDDVDALVGAYDESQGGDVKVNPEVQTAAPTGLRAMDM